MPHISPGMHHVPFVEWPNFTIRTNMCIVWKQNWFVISARRSALYGHQLQHSISGLSVTLTYSGTLKDVQTVTVQVKCSFFALQWFLLPSLSIVWSARVHCAVLLSWREGSLIWSLKALYPYGHISAIDPQYFTLKASCVCLWSSSSVLFLLRILCSRSWPIP